MCDHVRVSRQGYCVSCGAQLDLHLVDDLYYVRADFYQRLTNYQLETKRLEDDSALLFFLDLDNTVLEAQAQPSNRATAPKIEILSEFYEKANDLEQYAAYADKIQCFSFSLESTQIEARFRPRVFSFVHSIASHCKIVLSTLAARAYAQIIRRALDPSNQRIIDVFAREDQQVKSLAAGTRNSPILRQRSVVFDDSPCAWENEKIAFLKSVCFGSSTGTQSFSNQLNLVINSFNESLHSELAEKQLLSISALVYHMKSLRIKNCYSFVQYQQQAVFAKCVFYVPLNLYQYQVVLQDNFLISASFNNRYELIVQAINQFGGKVAVSSQIKGITHIVYTVPLILQYKYKLGIKTQPWSPFQEGLTIYGQELKKTPARGYYFVDSRFVYESCYLLARQSEERPHFFFLQYY